MAQHDLIKAHTTNKQAQNPNRIINMGSKYNYDHRYRSNAYS